MTPPRRPAPTAGPTWRDVEPTPLILLTGPEDYLAARARELINQGTPVAAACRIVTLEDQLAEAIGRPEPGAST